MNPISRSEIKRINSIINANRARTPKWVLFLVIVLVSAFFVFAFDHLAIVAMVVTAIVVCAVGTFNEWGFNAKNGR